MKKIICLTIAALILMPLVVSCNNEPAVTDETTDTAVTAPDGPLVFDEDDPANYRNGTDLAVADYKFENTITYEKTRVEFVDEKTSAGAMNLYMSAVADGSTVRFPPKTVAGVYPAAEASQTEKTEYTFDLTCNVGYAEYSWFTFYFGLRLSEAAKDPTVHTGVWLAMRGNQIGMRTGAWPETKYMKCDFDFSKGETVTVIDDPVENVITVYGGKEMKELARVTVNGRELQMFAPGKTEPSIKDKVDSEIQKGGYAHLWNHHTPVEVTLSNISATLMTAKISNDDNNGIKQNTRDIFSDTWTAYDDVDRTIGESGTAANGRKVGMFYFLWHEDSNNRRPLYDHTAAYEKGGLNELIKVMASGDLGFVHYWGEPYFGYYCSNDEWVIRKHGAMLSEAGVDFVFFDATNGPLYKKNYEAVMKVWTQMRKEGLKTPDVCFILKANNSSELNTIWKDLYSVGLYEDLWFRWNGKPVIMFTDSNNELTEEQKEFFTVRISWATESGGWYRDLKGINCWPWASMYKQKSGYTLDENGNQKLEEVTVMCGFWANGSFGKNAGRSYTSKTGEPKDKSEGAWDMGFGLYPQTSGLGLAYQECFDYALGKEPPLIMITGWNEWWAGRWEEVGHQIAYEYVSVFDKNDWKHNVYVDNLDPEYSRDIEPMKGGFNDNYYYQTVMNVRKYKGSRPVEAAFGQKQIDINGSEVQWFGVGPEYRDVAGDVTKRDHVSHVGSKRYTNDTGRNDILTAKVSSDGEYLYFFVECASDITQREGDNWMNLFIKSDNDDKNGWYGFDYVVNRSGTDGKASVEAFKDGWNFETVGEAEYVQSGKTLQIKVKRSLIGYDGKTLQFKWADNSVNDGDIMGFLDKGDAAPDARFCYKYATESNEAPVPACLTSDMAVFKCNGYNAYVNGKSVRLATASTKATLIASGYEFYLPKAFLTGALGINCDGEEEIDHYGIKYVKANGPVENSGKTVTVTPDGLLIIANEKITDTEVLDTLYRSLY